ncbi:MAG TPA: diguanylate cyclase, partial [bacterium]|nr:diguanylate cyclase [bacterium]
MTGYLLRRLLQAVVLLWIVTVITFVLIHEAPGGPAVL